jgi:hypothetical protein
MRQTIKDTLAFLLFFGVLMLLKVALFYGLRPRPTMTTSRPVYLADEVKKTLTGAR